MWQIILTFAAVSIMFVIVGALVITKAFMLARSSSQLDKRMPSLAKERNYTYEPSANNLSERGSYKYRTIKHILTGCLTESKNRFSLFSQIEDRDGFRSHNIGMRTIIEVKVPQTMTHYVIKSRILDRTKTRDTFYNLSSADAIDVSGYFATHFESFAPEEDRQQLLVLLQPEAMEQLINVFPDCDIEIDGDSLLVYAYRSLLSVDRLALVDKVDSLVANMKLASKDVKTSKSTLDGGVPSPPNMSRSATVDGKQQKLGVSYVPTIATGVSIVVFLFIFGQFGVGPITVGIFVVGSTLIKALISYLKRFQ